MRSSDDHHHRHHHRHHPAPDLDDLEDEDDIIDLADDDDDEDDDDMEDDDDDDTVVGTCLHCNAPPPPRSSDRCSVSSNSHHYSGGHNMGGGGNSTPCSANSMIATSAATSPSAATRVQVSCDDCRSFICDGCHWCHEFQANHEIRVCDRCDAFYCRGCDEMDQCEDCSEVVCNTCSTLMSCKFCGCGLCEDCATACGRCGIVLCARDAKFAVECDTCRMSYCLVCLASGTKDPCVRCGHRPSKRVEQLVHLRLKSIYKAFKQSGASVGPGSGNGGGGNNGSNSSSSGACGRSGDGGRDTSTMGGKYSSALRSLTENGPPETSSSKDNFSNFDQNMASEVAAVLQTASNSMANNSDGGEYSDGHPRRSRGKRISSHDHSPSSSTSRHRSSSRTSNAAAAERYFRKTQAEMEAAAAAAEAEAEAAAMALLAELDEEKAESKTASKKSKKKKKKKEKEKKKEAEQQQEEVVKPPIIADSDKPVAVKKVVKASSSTQKKRGFRKTPQKMDFLPIEHDSSDEEMDFALLVAGAKNNRPSKKEKSKEENISEEDKVTTAPPKPKEEPPPPPVEAAPVKPATTADFDAELAVLLSNDDEEGLEAFLANLKGVPGLGAARKTSKKALKKIREAKQPKLPEPQDEPEKVVTQSGSGTGNVATRVEIESAKAAKLAAKEAAAQKQKQIYLSVSTATPSQQPPSGNQHEPLLRVVSRTQSNVGTISSRGGNSNSTSIPASARAECVMHMSPAVVGWVIGKGGSRIRDMMEESGAKIWIDQESMGVKEARVVYVSGKRTSVDSAVRMVKDLVSKAPVAASASASSGVAAPAPASSASSSATTTHKSIPVPASTPTAPSPAPLEPVKEPASFAAAIGTSTPAAVTPQNSKPSTPTKQPQLAPPPASQVWALPSASPSGATDAHHVAPPQAKQPTAMSKSPAKAATTALEVRGAKPLPPTPDTIIYELTCDPRFVALLIGRRGWTVKNIQSESGADLHIDQTVDPPKIIMTGKAENVKKAEQLVREVLNYPHAQLHQEVVAPQPQNNKDMMSTINTNSMGIVGNIMAEQQRTANVAVLHQSSMNPPANSAPMMPLPTPSLRRDVSSSNPIQLQQEPSLQPSLHRGVSEGAAMNFQPGYAQYQQQQHQNNNLGLYQDNSSSAAARISEFLPNNDQNRQPLPSSRAQSHGGWSGHHGQAPPTMPAQYSTLPPFSGGQVSSTTDQYFLSTNNANAPSLAHQTAHDNVSQRPPSASFALPPPEQHLHRFSQNPEPVQHHHAPMQQPATQMPSRVNDFMNTGSSGHNAINGWDLPVPANGTAMQGGGSWNNQSHHHAPVASSTHKQPTFQAQAAPQPLSDNPFETRPTQSHQHITATSASQPSANILVSDDSLMVDNMFASLGASDNEGGGLLNALNSVSLGGVVPVAQPQQGGNNWGSKMSGWTEDTATSSFLQHSRLGDYRD